MRALEILGLEPGADERAIKRAYARLLKGCRPDDDPQGFQELRDAYEAALEQARRGAADNEDDEDGDGDYQEFDVSGAQTPPAVQRQAEEPPLKHHFGDPEPASPENEPVRPAPLYEPPRTAALLDGLNEENLNARWLEARARGERREFEEAVLTRCLWHLAPDEHTFAAQAQARFEWLTPGQRVTIDESQQNRLRHVLLTPYAEEMQAALQEGNDARFLACLRALANSPWLQSYDGQRQLQQLALTLLDAQPEWSAQRFAALCKLFHWDETRGERRICRSCGRRLSPATKTKRFLRSLLRSAMRQATILRSGRRTWYCACRMKTPVCWPGSTTPMKTGRPVAGSPTCWKLAIRRSSRALRARISTHGSRRIRSLMKRTDR